MTRYIVSLYIDFICVKSIYAGIGESGHLVYLFKKVWLEMMQLKPDMLGKVSAVKASDSATFFSILKKSF